MTSTFSFPVFPRKEIVTILSESGIANIREQDLINPNPDFIYSLYTSILVFLDPLQDDHGQPDFDALGKFENPDHHVDSVRKINLCHKIKELVVSLSCSTSFNLFDLIRPNTDRTTFFLSAILNFCLHWESKLNMLQQYVDKLNFHEGRCLELETRISQLNMENFELKDAREREQPFVLEVDAKVKELRQTIQGLNNHQMSLKASFRTLRDKTKEIEDKISNSDFALVQIAQENAKLRSKIVQSPDKLQGALENKKTIRAEVKDSERSTMQSFQEKNATLKVYLKAGKKMTKHLAQMQAIQEHVNSAKTIDKDVKVLKSKLSDEGVLDRSLEAKLVERQGKLEQLEESRKAFEKKRELKHEEVTKELNNVKLEFESKKFDLASRENNVEAMVAEVGNIHLKINSLRESGAATQQQLHCKCEEIVNEFHNYSQSIEAVIDRVEGGSDVHSRIVDVR